MSVYKDDFTASRLRSFLKLARLHAESINISFEVLNKNIHSTATCDTCQLHGKNFQNVVFSNLSNEVRQYVSKNVSS